MEMDKPQKYKCDWNDGDVYALQLNDAYSIEKKMAGRWALFQKVALQEESPGRVVPIVYIKISDDKRLPASQEEYERLDA